MRLLRIEDDGNFSLVDRVGNNISRYGVLSHTWGADEEEVTFRDLIDGTGKTKAGYRKICFCGKQAAKDDLQYFWVDTCCIDKSSSAELSEAINSMFRWYQDAAKCYVYLSDVSVSTSDGDNEFSRRWKPAFKKSRWFTRGWTLQELIAPASVEFFSKEETQLGDKQSLEQTLHEITGIAIQVLRGNSISYPPVDERMSWAARRETKREEDAAYCLLGIFDIHMPLLYGEGRKKAFARLQKEIQPSVQMEKEDKECVQHLRLTDPRDDKMRIEETKGGLLEDSYHWILENSDFQQWRDDQQSRLLWIKGDPGKGKTMLLCGIVNELKKLMAKTDLLSYFFCQATDSRINNATAVLRGLVYLLVDQQPSLISHIRKKHDQAGKSLFEDANSWVALSDIFKNILQDTNLKTTYLVIDALDECVTDLPKLLDFIVYTSSSSARVKWLLSSRNELHIEQKLRSADEQTRLSLELKENAEQVSRAVDVYIDDKLSRFESLQDDGLRHRVRDILRRKANGTFLWVALVVQELKRPESWDPLQVVEEVPTELHQLYNRMVNQIQQLTKRNSEVCRLILSIATVAYRPLYLAEIGSLCKLPGQISALTKNVRKIVAMCGSFLTVRDNQVYLIHQSAKDYLSDEARATIFPSQGKTHHDIFFRSLELMSSTLQRDMYRLIAPGFPIDQVQVPGQDPLGTTRYSCVHWVNHLYDSVSGKSTRRDDDLQDNGAVYVFLKRQYLYWLEALSLCKSMSEGIVSMTKLEALIQERENAFALIKLVRDARRFIMYHKWEIEKCPLQAYTSALVFSPARSLIRCLFKEEEPKWITIKPAIGDKWSACLQTLEGHSNSVQSVAFSRDSARLASASSDNTVKIWDASSGECLQTLEGHSSSVCSVAFSHDSARLASASYDWTVKIWDASSGKCLQTLESHSSSVHSVAFSHDSARLASASSDEAVKIWDASSGECLQTLKCHSDWVWSVAFSHDSVWLASALSNNTIKIWDASSGECLQTLKGHSGSVNSVAFSHDSARLASASYDWTVKIWNASSGECLQTLEGHSYSVWSVAFSHDSARLASASSDNTTVKIWDASSGECLQMLEGHSSSVYSVTFSHNSARLASASSDKMVKIWDVSSGECLQTLKGHSGSVNSVAFSHDSARLASASDDTTVKIWDVSSGECLQT
ncbi:beta transducin-like protein HET-D2Y, partial [Cenococcum geophilum 1.58]|uniref:beta transducin-like protein HET-D2Y n=1 Tax=Cenococcum geophilum 1.58 TaxID=794803 RepID=UPI00358EF805